MHSKLLGGNDAAKNGITPERKDIEGPKHPSQEPIITQEIKHPGGIGGGAQKPAQGQEEPKEEGKE